MIAADTSAWLDFSKGLESHRSRRLEASLTQGTLVMPLPVLFEVLSGPGITREASALILQLPVLELKAGFWQRAADTRRALLRQRFKARAMDCLIAQSCIDHGVALIASDQDYRHFLRLGLQVA